MLYAAAPTPKTTNRTTTGYFGNNLKMTAKKRQRNKVPVALTHKEEILQRVAEGERLSDIAETYGVSAMAISKQLTNDPEYQAVREIAALKRIEHWEKELEAINPESNAVMMQRADRMLAHSRWRAEKEHRMYAAKQEQQGTTIQVIITDPTKTVTIDQGEDGVIVTPSE